MNQENTLEMPDDFNHITIETYNNYADSYVNQTSAVYDGSRKDLQRWIDQILQHAKPNGNILEIGSATPRDALYMRSKGFAVQCSDATPNFVQHLNNKGELAFILDITKQPIHSVTDKKYDMVFANAVFPHFSEKDTLNALKYIYGGLDFGGIIAFNVKQGDEPEWIHEKFSGKRYINYWHPHEIFEAVSASGFEVISLDDGIEGERPTHVWTRIIAQKT